MGGDADKSAPTGTRGPHGRPHWWVVLAVALSLLALVAARATVHTNSPGPGRSTHAASSTHHSQKAKSTAPSTPDTATSSPGQSAGPVTPSTSAPSTPQGVPPANRARVIAKEATPAAAPTSTTTSVPAAVPAPPAPATETQQGYLQQPDDASAIYAFTGSGSMQVSASWTSASTLSLTVTCPAGTQTEEGSTVVTVVLPDADGACEVALRETEVDYDAISYNLTIGPTDGG